MFFVSLRSPFHLCLEPLLAGVAVAIAHAHGVGLPDRRLGKMSIAAAMAALLLWLAAENFMSSISWRDIVLQPILLAGLFALLVHGAVLMGRASLPFEPVVRVAARLSYTLYLVHIPIIPLALAIAGVDDDRLARFWIVYLLCSICAALILHYLIEKPFLLLKAQMEYPKANSMPGFPAAAAVVRRSTLGTPTGFFRKASNDARL
jgi:peptidoglycan/LPS O-acetylase OafA/YrhL